MNLVIITSVLDPPNNIPFSYTNIRSVYSVEERYYQTLETIKSIVEKIPNFFIVILECSDPSNDYVKKLQLNENVYKFFNYYEDENVKKHVYGKFKGMGEASLLKTFLDNNDTRNFENIFKISGRYKLNDFFNYKIFDNNENVFKISCETVVTCLFKISQNNIEEFKKLLNKSLEILSNGESIEKVFLDLLKNNFKNVNSKIGIIGYCAVAVNDIIDH
jgi:hypothetical protein